MTTQYRHEKQMNRLKDSSIPPQKQDSLNQPDCVPLHLNSFQKRKWTFFPEKIFECDDSLLRKQCGRYVLIEQIIAKGETAPNVDRSKTLARLANQLLTSCSNLRITVTCPNAPAPIKYHGEMIEKARAILENASGASPLLLQSALSLLANTNELTTFFSKAWGKMIPYRLISLKKYLSSWHQFVTQYFLHRIKSIEER